jgi:hypothetical protein
MERVETPPPPALVDWLVRGRDDLNQRFRRAKRRFPHLAPDAVLKQAAAFLAPLAGPEPNAPALLSSVYDLIILHAGRDAFGTRPGLAFLLGEAFPKIRALLLQTPTSLPAALSNAVENLGATGPEFARGIVRLASQTSDPEAFRLASAVLAWRLGEARLRANALEATRRLSPRVVLAALGLFDWPDEAAPVVLACLEVDSWTPPRKALSDNLVSSLRGATAEAVVAIVASVRSAVPGAEWQPVGAVGGFSGFGGNFETPPLLLQGGDRHRFLVKSGDATFQVAADTFGWRCRPTVLAPASAAPPAPATAPFASATSFALFDDVAASTSNDSFRIRVWNRSRIRTDL